MVVTMCTSGAVVLKAGTNAKILPDADYVILINQAESYLNAVTLIDYTTAYAGLSDETKKILEDACSSRAAMGVINNDMSGFTNNAEAVQMINYNWAIVDQCEDLLKNKEVAPDFIG